MQRSKFARTALVVMLAGCVADAGNPLATGGEARLTIADAAHAGSVPGFYFLPPMVKAPSYAGTFDPGLSPRVEVCELSGVSCGTVLESFTMGPGSAGVRVSAADEHYGVNWHAPKSLDAAKSYRITVYVGALELGHADVKAVANGGAAKGIDRSQFAIVKPGSTLPIRFRIETGIVAQVLVDPDSAEIPVGGAQQFTATLLDLHGDPLTGPSVAWASSDEDVATVDQDGLATGVSPGAATITATAQAASGAAVLTVFNPNLPPVAEPDTFRAIGNFTVPVSAPGVLANDTDPDANPLSAVPGTFPTAQGGTFTLEADGGFTYLSAPGFTGQDEVVYEITDGLATASASVAFVVPTRVWYVSNAGDAPGDGRDASPFVDLKPAESASLAGETIFVLAGDGTSAGLDEGIVLKNGQSLTGQGVPASVSASLNGETVVLLPAGGAPSLTRIDGGATILLAQGNTVQGVDVASTAGAGIAGTGFGTLTVASVSVAATGGPSLELENGTVAAAFDALSSAGSAGAGLRLANVAGVLSASAGSIAGAAGAGIEVSGGNADVSYGGNVASVGPRPVSVTGRTGGTLALSGTIASTGQGILVQANSGGSITFSGASKTLNTGPGHAVELADNAGATVGFAGGGLAIATAGGDGFRATGGGTITVTGAGNTVVSAGGAAVRVENTTIGAAGLSFRSVSASGGTNGIVLSNTGALNGMQVTGTGVAGSGGTIRDMTGADGATAGVGVYLSGARNVSLRHMLLHDFSNFAIRGAGVVGFTLANSTVSGANGDNAAFDEGSISFDELTGSATLAEASISGGFTDNLRVANSTGTLDRLTISASTIGLNAAATGDDGVVVEATATAVVNVTVQNSTFAGARGDLFQLTLSGSAVSDLVLSGSTLHNAHPATLSGAGGVLVNSTSGSPTVTYSVAGNSFRGAAGGALAITKGVGTGSFSGTVSGNTVGAAGVPNSGSSQGSGIVVDLLGGGSHTAAVLNNQVTEFTNFGIRALAGNSNLGGQGRLEVTIQGNTVTQPSANAVAGFFPTSGIRVQSGNASGDSSIVCATVGGTGVGEANSVTGTGVNGGRDIRVFQRFLTSFALPGYAGAPNDNTAVAAFLQARNSGAPTVQVTNNVAAGGPGITGVCPS